VPSEWRFVIASSGVRAEKTGAVRSVYNALSRDASALLQLWNEHEAPAGSLGEALATDALAAKRLAELVERLPDVRSREPLVRRLTHFVLEDRRVPEAVAAFSSTNAEALAALASESQRDAEALLHNQIPETVELAAAARRLGAIGVSAFGAGFGGSVWAVVERDAVPTFPARWLAACRPAALPDATAFEALPAPPLTLLTL
jgi:galactokinase